nr:sirohydrochlorin cobaltochelatase [Photobacterium sanguinicancri]
MKRLRHYNQGTAIVLSCFGSVVEQQRYVKLQQHISELYPDCHVRMATSSKMVIKKLAGKGEMCQSLPQVLADLDTQGYQHILVVSCYLFPTDEHLYLTKIVDGFKQFSLSRIGQTPAIMHHSQLATKLLGALHQRFPVDQGVTYIFTMVRHCWITLGIKPFIIAIAYSLKSLSVILPALWKERGRLGY